MNTSSSNLTFTFKLRVTVTPLQTLVICESDVSYYGSPQLYEVELLQLNLKRVRKKS